MLFEKTPLLGRALGSSRALQYSIHRGVAKRTKRMPAE
jgi:hypothetical protein